MVTFPKNSAGAARALLAPWPCDAAISLLRALLVAAVLSGCSNGARSPLPATQALGVTQQLAVPVERITRVRLSSRYSLDTQTQPVRNGTFVFISNVTVVTYGGTATIADGPNMPAGIPHPPGAKKMLFIVTFTVDEPVTTSGTLGTWTVGFQGNPGCLGLLTTGFYSSGGQWNTFPGVCAGDVYIFPTWTLLKAHSKYVAATFTT